jgi:hypothetical protein
MSRILKAAAAAVLLAGGATIALAQMSKNEPGSPDQGPGSPPGTNVNKGQTGPATGPSKSKVEPGGPDQGPGTMAPKGTGASGPANTAPTKSKNESGGADQGPGPVPGKSQ